MARNLLIEPKLTPAQEFDFESPAFNISEFAVELAETMLEQRGLWLTAPQVGVGYRICLIASSPIIAMVNPRVVNSSKELIALEEGGLSWPGIIVKVKRPENVRVRYTQPNGETLTKKFSGVTSRLVQQCVSTLEGKDILYGVDKYHKDAARRRQRRLVRDGNSGDLVARAYSDLSFELARRQHSV